MKTIITFFAVGAVLVLAAAQPVLAMGQPGTSAGVNCGSGSALLTPGHSASSPGAPFNEPSATSSGGKAGQVYAGSGPSAIHAGSPNAVSQYDIACQNVTQKP
jgi:hypothetical protein